MKQTAAGFIYNCSDCAMITYNIGYTYLKLNILFEKTFWCIWKSQAPCKMFISWIEN